MKKSSLQLRGDIAKLQEQLRQAETREAERIGRIAMKAGIGEIEIEETKLQAGFEDLAKRFRGGKAGSSGEKKPAGGEAIGSGAAAGGAGEA